MLAAILLRGNYDGLASVLPLATAVIGLDIVYSTMLRLVYRQMTYTLDFMLLLLLNISVMFQSCFGRCRICVQALCNVYFSTCHVSAWIFADAQSCVDPIQKDCAVLYFGVR